MGDFIVNMLNNLIQMVGALISVLAMLLPDSPFQLAMDSSVITDLIAHFNWFFPVTEILATVQAWVTAMALYYIIMVPMRYIKMME